MNLTRTSLKYNMQTTQPGVWEESVVVLVNGRRETSEATVQRFSFHSSLSLSLVVGSARRFVRLS
jgi:hypothetical protein